MSDDVTYIPAERVIELIEQVAEINAASEMLQDEDVDKALAYIVSLMNDPNKPMNLAAPLIVKLTAMSVVFKLQAKMFQFRAKGNQDATNKKNLYYSLSEGLELLAAALKYIVRN